MNTEITFITGNRSKAEQLSKYLGITVVHRKIEMYEVQSLILKEVIEEKAKEAFKHLQSPVIVDDASLVVSPMGSLPGPFIKHFITELGTDGICKMVSNFKDNSALAEVGVGYYDGKNLKFFSGAVRGNISSEPRGKNGFGWDAVFIPTGYSLTRAEMSEEDYDVTSPRKIALDKLHSYLETIYKL